MINVCFFKSLILRFRSLKHLKHILICFETSRTIEYFCPNRRNCYNLSYK